MITTVLLVDRGPLLTVIFSVWVPISSKVGVQDTAPVAALIARPGGVPLRL